MIVPYKEPRPVPRMAWLLDHQQVLHENGRTEGLAAAVAREGVQVWAGYDHINELLYAGRGEALCWDNKPIRWSPDVGVGTYAVRVLRVPYPQDERAAVRGLAGWRSWLAGYGAAPAGSLGGTGISLVKATLEAPLWTALGDVPPVRFALGGRQEVGPAATWGAATVYDGHLHHLDIRAAYAQTLGELRYGGHWHHFATGRGGYPLPTEPGGPLLFVRARVQVPDMAYGPLPERPRAEREALLTIMQPVVYPTARTFQGTWTWEELLQAEASGCKILRVLDVWKNNTTSQPFLPWWAAVEQGRAMAGFAGQLAKATGNATWGMFAVRAGGRRQVLRVAEGGRRDVSKPLGGGGNPSLRAPDLAEQITGRVRAELHRGMVLAGGRLACAHTDGIWAFATVTVPGWRRKRQAAGLRLLNPQALAYSWDGAEEYVVAGVPEWRAAQWFEERWAAALEETQGRPWALGGPVPGQAVPVVRDVRHLRAVG